MKEEGEGEGAAQDKQYEHELVYLLVVEYGDDAVDEYPEATEDTHVS